ncbi:MAG: glycosyltransferase family 39 protein [Chloroflexi bacterium]|nr:glycosyltransferase family 39 protein [Chloroflexota bacterium]
MADTLPLATDERSGLPSSSPKGVWPGRLAWLLPLLFGALALVLLVGAAVPTPLAADRLAALRGGAAPGASTLDLLSHLAERMRLAALLCAGVGLVFFLGRRQTERFAREAADDTPSLLRDTRSAILAVRRQSTLHQVVLLSIVLLGAGFRLVYLQQPIRYDEAFTFTEFASRPLYYALSFYPEPNNQLLHTLLVHVSYLAFGNQLWAIRLPAFLAGVLTVPATYLVGRQLYGASAALLAAGLVAASSVLIEYSTNARGYTIVSLLFLIGVALVAYGVRHASAAAPVAAAVVMALGFYAIPTTLYAFATLLAWAVWAGGFRRPTRWLALAGLVIVTAAGSLLVYLPPLIVSGLNNLLGNRFVVPLDWASFASELPRSLAATWTLWTRDLPPPIVAVLVAAFGLGLVLHPRLSRVPGPPLLVAALVGCLPILVAQRVVPFERVWLFLLPAVLLTVSAGLVWVLSLVKPRQLDSLVSALALAATLGLGLLVVEDGSVLRSDETGNFPDAQAVTGLLAGRLAPDDSVVTSVPASLPELQYYFRRDGLDAAALVRPPTAGGHVYLVATPAAPPPTNASLLASFPSAVVYEAAG